MSFCCTKNKRIFVQLTSLLMFWLYLWTRILLLDPLWLQLLLCVCGVEHRLYYTLNGRKLCTMLVFALCSIFGEMQQITCAPFINNVPSPNFTLTMHQYYEFSYKILHSLRKITKLIRYKGFKMYREIDFPSIFILSHVRTLIFSGKLLCTLKVVSKRNTFPKCWAKSMNYSSS